MKRCYSLLWIVLALLSIYSLGGCKLLMETNVEKEPIKAPPLKVTTKVAPVQPDEVTPANARNKAQQLLNEIDQEEGNNQ